MVDDMEKVVGRFFGQYPPKLAEEYESAFPGYRTFPKSKWKISVLNVLFVETKNDFQSGLKSSHLGGHKINRISGA